MFAAVLAFIPTWIKLAIAGLAGAVLLSAGSYLYGKHEGRQQAAVAALQSSVKAYKDRNNENSTVEALDPISLCVELGGLPDDCRAELRRLGEDRGQIGDGGLSGGQ